MRLLFAIVLAVHVCLAPAARAQSLAPGNYSGRVQVANSLGGREINELVTLTIEKVGRNRFEGVAWVGTSNCRIDVPVRGRLVGETLRVWAIRKMGECGIFWELKLEGEKLEGVGRGDLTLRLSK